jgi:hypothetical protein
MRRVVLAAVALAVACTNVRGSGTAKTEERAVPAFTTVDVGSGIQADVRVGPAGPVSVTADDNILPLVESDVDQGRLVVRLKEPASTMTKIHVVASAPSITAVHASSGADVKAAGLTGLALALDASSGATLHADGSTKSLAVTASGGATLDASGLVAANVVVSASGGAKVGIQATAGAGGTAGSGASVHVAGSPKGRAITENSGGHVVFE